MLPPALGVAYSDTRTTTAALLHWLPCWLAASFSVAAQQYKQHPPHFTMTYEKSFLSTCDAEGNAPAWAFAQIFLEHGSSADEYLEATPEPQWFNGQSILHWLGY